MIFAGLCLEHLAAESIFVVLILRPSPHVAWKKTQGVGRWTARLSSSGTLGVFASVSVQPESGRLGRQPVERFAAR